MTVVSFIDYEPLARYDGQPWTKAVIQEAAAEAGPWTTIETITFLDPDADPANPKQRSFTTELATLVEGWYKVIFQDAGGQQSPTVPIHNVESVAAEFYPLVSDVGSLLRSRTKDTNAVELGTFTNDTRPTAEQVRVLIDQAVQHVIGKVDSDLPAAVFDEAKAVITLLSAMLVELSFFPEQIPTGRSAYDRYKELYDEALAVLLEAVNRENAEEVGGETASGNAAVGHFPVDAGGMVGWQTRW